MQHDEKLPVWVFIYGGRRLMGNGLPYKYGPEYIMDKPVILVLIAYRIGPVGKFERWLLYSFTQGYTQRTSKFNRTS